MQNGWLIADAPPGPFAAENLPLLLWSGLAVLTLALLILMQTRWGQAKPLSKCVVLSVFAHVLFIAYAYGTRLIFDHPHTDVEVPIRLAMIQAEASDAAAASAQQPEPWNRLAAQTVAAPEVGAPRPQSTELQLPQQQQEVSQPGFEANLQPTTLPVEEPQRPLAEPAPAPPPVNSVAPSEIEIAPGQLQPATPDDTPITLPRSLPRKSEGDEAPMPPAPESPQAAADQLFDEAAQLQRLSDLPVMDDPADVARAEADQPRATSTHTTEGAAAGSTASGSAMPESPTAQPAAVTSGRRRLGDGALLPELYQLRAAAQREEIANHYGGNPQTEAAVEAALKWLAGHQQTDGRWDASEFDAGHEKRVLGHDRQGVGAEADTGITGLALLALLGAGQTHFEGTYRRSVQRGLEFLLHQQRENGSLAGNARFYARMYCHGIATLAISEAYAMTGDYRLQPYVQRAIDYTVHTQHPTTGGWRYQPGDRGDMSQFGWQVMALKSAELAGITFPAETRAAALRFLNEVSSGASGGLASYRRGEQVSPTMTAEALACRLFLDQPIGPALRREAGRYLLQQQPGTGQVNLYYWYYASMSLFQLQGDAWLRWNDSLQTELLRLQRNEGSATGSWDPNTVWGGYGGRVYATAMAALSLEVYYRYLPVLEQGTAKRD